ncbi:MAG: hypothetical protein L3J63_11775 [Geopsychrobacter sp.]|nr:hypothetical protein [Geopsychrobacter sp.]
MTTDLHDAIETHLRAAFTRAELPTCEQYPDLRKKILAPAVLIELDELVPADDPGTDELALTARFAAYVVLQQTAKAGLAAANLAALVALRVVQGGRFGQPVGPARLTRVAAADFKPELIGYAAWVAEWNHEIRIGDSTWDGTGIPVTQIMLGWSPDIGLGHEADYEEVKP